MNRIEAIQKILNTKKRSRYLEIGVRNGQCFLEIAAGKKYAVDPHFVIPKKRLLKKYWSNWSNINNRYFEVTSDDFFAQRNPQSRKFDVVFIDGLHTYDQSLRDAENSIGHLKEDGFIVLHDCNPTTLVAATPAPSFEDVAQMNLPGWKGIWNGEVWKTIVHLRTTHPELFVCVLDCDFGLGIVSKKKIAASPLVLDTATIANMTYADLEKNRSGLLNLREPAFLETLVAS